MTLACVSVLIVLSYVYTLLKNVRISNAEKISLRDNSLGETRRIFIGTPIYTGNVC